MPNLETIHQNEIEPNITAELIFPNYGQTRVSYNPPYNTGTIRFKCNKDYDKFIARVNYGDQIVSPEHGILVAELDGATAGTYQQFTFDTLEHFPPQSEEAGVFDYRLNLYIQDGETIWNYEYKLFEENGRRIISKNNEYMYVMAKGEIITNNTP